MKMTMAMMVAMTLSAGCTSGLLDTKQPALQTYMLSAGDAQPAASAALAIDLAVARPIIAPGLYTERIAVRHADRRLDYYTGSRWGATSDMVVQSLLVESLRNAGRLSSVQSDMSAFSAQYLLQTELRDFQAEYAHGAGAPKVHVGLVCTLGRIKAREPLREYSAGATAQASDNNMRAVVAAFEEAYREAAKSLVEQTLTVLEAQDAEQKKQARQPAQ